MVLMEIFLFVCASNFIDAVGYFVCLFINFYSMFLSWDNQSFNE